MRVVGLKLLKNRLSEYVRLAANGETVLITDRNRVVAELSAPRTGGSPIRGDTRFAEAVRNAWLTPQRAAGTDPPPRAPMTSWQGLAKDLAADRDDR